MAQLIYADRSARKEGGLFSYASMAGPEQWSPCLDVFGEGLAAGFGDAIEGGRLAQHELLFDRHAPGFFEPEQLAHPGCRRSPQSWRGAEVNSASSTLLSSASRASRSLP